MVLGNEAPVGCLLRKARLAAGMTQEDLAARSGLSVRAIGALERDQTRRPYLRSVGLLADALQVSESVRAQLYEAVGRVWQGHERVRLPVHSSDAEADGWAAAPSARPGSWTVPQQLPFTVSDFVGRDVEISQLTASLSAGSEEAAAQVRSAVISGQPGVGKTTLALRVAHALRPLFPDGQLWVQLAGASARPRDPGEVLGELLRAVGVEGSAIPERVDERAGLFRSRMADRRALLVADDAASSAQILPLLPGTAGSAVVVTSRARLAGVPGATAIQLDPFTQSEAVGLLTHLVGEERIAADPNAALELVGACGLVPLAVRIAGARLVARPAWPVSLLARRMTGERRQLDELEIEDQSVRVSFALSYEGLSDLAKRAFRLVSLLGPYDIAEWVFAALLEQQEATRAVSELTDKSLLTPTGIDATGQPRYRLHDLLREYASERLGDESASESAAALQRVLCGWLQLIVLADDVLPPAPYFPRPVQAQLPGVIPAEVASRLVADPVAWFTSERLNLLYAAKRAAASGYHDLAIELASRQASFQHLQNRNDDATQLWLEIVDIIGKAGETTALAYARLRRAAALVERGQAADAKDLLDDCMKAFERMEDEAALTYSLYWRASCVFDLGFWNMAQNDAQRGAALAARAGNGHAEFLNLRQLALALVCMGQHGEGLRIAERAVSMASELGERSYEMAALRTLNYIYILVGQHESALALSQRLLASSRQLGDVRDEGLALGVLGDAHHGLGRYREAISCLSEALAIFRGHANRRYHALCLLKLGYASQKVGEQDQAAAYLEASLAMFRELRLPHYVTKACEALARNRPTRSRQVS